MLFRSTTTPVEETDSIEPLTGPALLAKIKELGDVSKSDLVHSCGYYSKKSDDSERLNFTGFYEALLEAKGIEASSSSSDNKNDADVSQPTNGQRRLGEQAAGTLESADQASSLPLKDMEKENSNGFDLAITAANYQAPDDDGDTRYEVEYNITNRSDQTIELLLARLFVLHPSGLVVATTEDESEDMAENGESISASSSTWGTSVQELDGDASSAQLMLQVTACSCHFEDLGSIECPSTGSSATLKPIDQSDDALIVEAITITAEPPDDGECRISIKALINNSSDLSFPRAVLATNLKSASGRELDDTYTQEEIPPNSQVVVEDSFWGVKENRMKSAKFQFSLKAFAASGISTAVTRDLSVEV